MSSAILVIIFCSIAFLLFAIFFVVFAFVHNKRMVSNHNRIQDLEKEKGRNNLINAIQIQEKERARIGVDIHDDLGPTVSAINLKVNRLADAINDKEEDFDELKEMIKDTIANIRAMAQSMYPNTFEKHGVINALQELANRITSVSDIEVICKVDPYIASLDTQYQLSIYRIIQEFCNNSIKHSNCDLIKINILEKADILTVEISDNGVGFEHKSINSDGLGLQNMKMRAEAIDFNFDLQSGEKLGTKLLLYQ